MSFSRSFALLKMRNMNVRDMIATSLFVLFFITFFQEFLPLLIKPYFEICNPLYPAVSVFVVNANILLFCLYLKNVYTSMLKPKFLVPIITVAYICIITLSPTGRNWFLDWSFESVTLWMSSFLVSFIIFWRKNPDVALYLSIWLTHALSNFYELPLFSYGNFDFLVYMPGSPLFLHIKNVAFVFLLFALYEHWSVTKKRWLTVAGLCVGLIVFSFLWYLALRNGFGEYLNNWTFRLPYVIWGVIFSFYAAK